MNDSKDEDSNQLADYPADLIWQCRRGMLELDLLLQPFLKTQWCRLTPEAQTAFRALLVQPDPLLYAWIMGQTAVPEEFNQIVQCIRQANHSAALGD